MAAALPAVSWLSPRLSFNTPRQPPLVASGRIRSGTQETSGATARMATAQSERLSPPPRIANQTTLLEHSELSALRGLAPPDSLRPALERRHLRPVLGSSEFAVDAEFTFPMNISTGNPAELRSKQMAMDTGASPWGRIAYAGGGKSVTARRLLVWRRPVPYKEWAPLSPAGSSAGPDPPGLEAVEPVLNQVVSSESTSTRGVLSEGGSHDAFRNRTNVRNRSLWSHHQRS